MDAYSLSPFQSQSPGLETDSEDSFFEFALGANLFPNELADIRPALKSSEREINAFLHSVTNGAFSPIPPLNFAQRPTTPIPDLITSNTNSLTAAQGYATVNSRVEGNGITHPRQLELLPQLGIVIDIDIQPSSHAEYDESSSSLSSVTSASQDISPLFNGSLPWASSALVTRPSSISEASIITRGPTTPSSTVSPDSDLTFSPQVKFKIQPQRYYPDPAPQQSTVARITPNIATATAATAAVVVAGKEGGGGGTQVRPRSTRRRKYRDMPAGDSPEASLKRARFLERNRKAAKKCRGTKKGWISNLEEELRFLERENIRLRLEEFDLRAEVLVLNKELRGSLPLVDDSGQDPDDDDDDDDVDDDDDDEGDYGDNVIVVTDAAAYTSTTSAGAATCESNSNTNCLIGG